MSSEIRISGGILKDKKIRVLKQGIYRITMEQVRKSIFDLLGEKIQSSIFLDLFAGS
ncbi:MAG: RsmD family RNA methyltransferase, partial [Dictyoglomus sp.]